MTSAVPRLAAVGLLVVVGCGTASPPADDAGTSVPQPAVEASPAFELLGLTEIPGTLKIAGITVGGLSGLAWEPTCNQWIALSDDPGWVGPPRALRLAVALDHGRLNDTGVQVEANIVLRRPDGLPFARGTIDAEGVAVGGDGSLYVSSEGHVNDGVPGWVRHFAGDGTFLEELELPRAVRERQRHNLGIEGLSVSPGGGFLIGGVENALEGDGPVPGIGVSSPARILRWDLRRGGLPQEFLYRVEPLPDTATRPGGMQVNGVSEIIALSPDRLLVLERSYAEGVGNRARIFLAHLDPAAEVTGEDRLTDDAVAMPKQQVADLDALGVDPDNIEAMALGPDLEDGRRLLLMVSDNNFNPAAQATQVVALAVSGVPRASAVGPLEATVAEIQGRGWISPYAGRCVAGVGGVVTAVQMRRDGNARVWMQDPEGDGDPATSDALVLRMAPGFETPAVGDRIEVEGRVDEVGHGLDLPITSLVVGGLEMLGHGAAVPAAVELAPDGMSLGALGSPHEGDGSGALGLFERLEGMRVVVPPSAVIGPTASYGQTVVLPTAQRSTVELTPRGGLLLEPGDDTADRLLVDDDLRHGPRLRVGDRLDGPLTGVLDLSYGAWQVLVTDPWPKILRGGLTPETTSLVRTPGRLTVATFNVENLSAVSPQLKLDRLAEVVAHNLAGPDLVALQEIQDDTGPEDDGVVSAALTLGRLVDAIAGAGGPRYEWRQLDPANDADGGQPGGNIRVALLLDPTRVRSVDRTGAADRHGVEILAGPHLSPSPTRLFADDAAFGGDPEGREGGTRKPLAVELEFEGRPLFLVNLHLSSKWGDDPLFGRRQPPVRPTDAMRVAQAELVRSFAESILDRGPEARVIVLGDCNDFWYSDAVQALSAGRLENLHDRLPVNERYTYIYRGSSQTLDHVLVSPALAEGAEIDIVHVDSELEDEARASDHDPIVVRLTP